MITQTPINIYIPLASKGQEYTENVIIELQSKYNQLSMEEYQLLKVLHTLNKKQI